MLPKITYTIAQQLALQAIELKGRDFIYTTGEAGCLYLPAAQIITMDIPSSSPAFFAFRRAEKTDHDVTAYTNGCIVGNMLLAHGVPASELLSCSGIDRLYSESGLSVEITPKALLFMNTLQEHQDLGNPWGASYDRAVSRVMAAHALLPASEQ